MRKRSDPLRALARGVVPALRGFGRRVYLHVLLTAVFIAFAAMALSGGAAPSGDAGGATSAGVVPGARFASLGFHGAVAAGPAVPNGEAGAADAAVSSASFAHDAAELLSRATRMAWLLDEVEAHVRHEVVPIERVLLQYRPDPVLARRIAVALVGEARRVDVEPRLLLAVLLVENPWLDPKARSSVGATGLMQVMPMHRGLWPPCGPDLEGVESNICYGARIFAEYYRQERGDVERALLRYNGCVLGTNTPNCHTYPDQVYARAGRASILAWLRPLASSAASP